MAGVFENWVRRVCERVARDLPVRFIPDISNVYMARYYVHPKKDPVFDDNQREREGAYQPRSQWAWHLQHIRQSDADQELHNHPWGWALSLILTGGYEDERRKIYVNGTTQYIIERITKRPGSFNLILADTYHRVDLLDEKNGAWTLLLAGPRVQDWGFWCRETLIYTPWREFVTKKSKRGGYTDQRLRTPGERTWIPDDHAAGEVPWNGDEEVFGRAEPEKEGQE